MIAMSLNDDMLEIHKNIENIISKSEKNIIINYAKTLESLRTSIRKLYDKYADKQSKLSFVQMNKGSRLNDFEKNITENLANLYKNNDKIIKSTLDNVFVTTKDNIIDAVEANKEKKVKSLLHIKKELDIDKTVNENMAGLHWAHRTKHHRNNVIYNVNSTLKEGLAQGSTYKEMSDRLSKSLNQDVLKPMRIIRTESARVYSSTKMQSLDKCASSGIEMVKIWHSVKDERVRNQHRQMDGVIVNYNDDFELPDGTKTKAPCLSGVAKHDIHCRCFITTDLKDFYKDEDLQNKTKENLNIPEIKNDVVKKDAENFDKILEKRSKESMHATKMRAYFEMTDFVEDTNLRIPFTYNIDDDVIKYNTKLESYDFYDKNYVLSHELSHRMDILEYNCANNKTFLSAIEKSKNILYNDKQRILSWFDNGGKYYNEAAITDIISGLSNGEYNDILMYSHNPNYWRKEDNLQKEIFANLSCIDILDDEKFNEFKELFEELFDSYLEIIK